jgi:hypothetical protein
MKNLITILLVICSFGAMSQEKQVNETTYEKSMSYRIVEESVDKLIETLKKFTTKQALQAYENNEIEKGDSLKAVVEYYNNLAPTLAAAMESGDMSAMTQIISEFVAKNVIAKTETITIDVATEQAKLDAIIANQQRILADTQLDVKEKEKEYKKLEKEKKKIQDLLNQ